MHHMIKITDTLHYNPTTGVAWYTIPKCYSRILTAKDTSGYLHARVGPKKYRLHQLAYMAIHGPIPTGMQIDHIDCNKRNNAIANLRAVDPLMNARNRKPKANASGYPGVRWDKRKKTWSAHLEVFGKEIWRGYGRDARIIYNSYRAAKILHHGEDSVRHYPPPIDISRFSVAKYQQFSRGKVKITRPKPHRSDYMWAVLHKGKRVFSSLVEQDARYFAASLRGGLDNNANQIKVQP